MSEPCPYDGAHEPGEPILCWSPGGPCEVPNAPECETCGPCNHCDIPAAVTPDRPSAKEQP